MSKTVNKNPIQPLFAVLKGLTIACVPLMLVPGIFISVSVFGQQYYSWPDFWKGAFALGAATLLAALLGLLAVRYVERKTNPKITVLLQVLSYAASVPVCLLLACLLWPARPDAGFPLSLVPWLPSFAVLELCWFFTVRRIPGSYTKSFSMMDFVRCAAIYLAPLLVLLLLEKNITASYNIMPMAFSFGIFTAITAVVINQQTIDIMMERRRHDKASLPAKIRVYNLMMIVGLLLVVFVGLLFAEQIGAGLVWALKRILLLVIYLFMFLFWIAGAAQGGSSGGGEEASGGGNELASLAANEEASPIWNIVIVVLIAAVIYLVIVNRRRIWDAVSGFFSKLLSWLYHFFLDSFKIQELGSAEGYYTEEAEALSREETPAKTAGFRSKRELKRALRSWQKTEDPVLRVRDGYRLLMMAANSQGSGLVPSDTTGRILEKSRESVLESAFSQANPVYDRVRYGGFVPDAAELSGFAAGVEEGCLSVDVKKKKEK